MRTELKKGEELLLVIRHHWIQLVVPFLLWIVVGVLAAIYFNTSAALIIILIVALCPLYYFMDWYHNIWAVTNLRVIDEKGFISRNAKESPLEKINNIEYRQSFIGRIMGYGDVDIQTAAEMGETSYKLIHHPRLLKDTITRAREETKSRDIAAHAQQLAQAIAASQAGMASSPAMIADELNKLFELKQKGAITEQEYEHQKRRLMN
jgi:uncharacterized membrane protein YdbT with pleckstrin-like domain